MLDNENIIKVPTPIVEIFDDLLIEKQVRVFVKQDYLTHKEVSGNKWRKLKYNLIEAKKLDKNTLVSFGGAYSNHIHALAAASHYFGFQSIGIIRGDELNESSSKTLRFAAEKGMKLYFIDRTSYRHKDISCVKNQENCYLVPEGGSNELALLGVAEMVEEIYQNISPDYICCAMGTGGTVAGILSSKLNTAKTIGFSVLKGGNFLMNEVENFLQAKPQNFELETNYHFGGYGKFNTVLEQFIENFEEQHQIPLDPIYTGKLFYGVMDKIRNGDFESNSKILLIHTGGLQGKK